MIRSIAFRIFETGSGLLVLGPAFFSSSACSLDCLAHWRHPPHKGAPVNFSIQSPHRAQRRVAVRTPAPAFASVEGSVAPATFSPLLSLCASVGGFDVCGHTSVPPDPVALISAGAFNTSPLAPNSGHSHFSLEAPVVLQPPPVRRA